MIPAPHANRPETDRPRLAAIDLGTNSVRLIVAQIDGPDMYRVLDDEREQTRLGFRLDQTGRLDDANAEATLDALRRMKAIAADLGAGALRTIATAALREAENGPQFVDLARERIGLEIEVISPEEEAELALRSVRQHFGLDRPTAIVDIGGGSMEVVFTTAGSIDRIHSLPLGAVRLTERFVHSDPVSESDWRALRAGIDRELKDTLRKPVSATSDMIGSGGTFTTVARMAMRDRRGERGPVQGYSMSRAEFEHQVRRLREAPLAQRRNIPGLSPNRADIILAGATTVSLLARRLDVERILINDLGVRDGLLLDMISRESGDAGGQAPWAGNV